MKVYIFKENFVIVVYRLLVTQHIEHRKIYYITDFNIKLNNEY